MQALLQKLTRLVQENTAGKGFNTTGKTVSAKFEPNDISINPFKDLPNVRSLRLRTNRLDPLLGNKGVMKKLAPEMTFEERSWRIKAANRYLRIMHFRLTKLLFLNRNVEFWILALQLMSKSKVLRACALRKLNHNWHRKFKFGLVSVLLRKLDQMIQDLPTGLNVKRQYEPKVKPDGTCTWRPIGNPGYADRMFLYLLQSFLVIYLNRHISKSQHAYRPGQGVPTALTELNDLLPKCKYAWEFDLKGAFPSVSISQTCSKLTEVGIPKPLSDYFEAMSIVTVERVDLLPPGESQRIPEPKFEKQVMLGPALSFIHNVSDKDFKFGWGSVQQQFIDTTAWAFNRNPKDPELLAYCMKHPMFPKEPIKVERTVPVPVDTFVTPSAATNRLLHAKMLAAKGELAIEVQGFPQGAGTSPILFNFAFEQFLLKNHFSKLHPSVKVVSYADDFLVFSDVDLPAIWDLPEKSGGLVINREKSRKIKDDGKFIVDKFKYLGVTFHVDVEPILLEGTPRSGSHLVFDKAEMVADYNWRDQQLRRFIHHFKDMDVGVPSRPQLVLDQWGHGELPSCLLPLEVVKGEAPISFSLLRSIETALTKSGSLSMPHLGHHSLDNLDVAVEGKGNPVASEALMKRISKAPNWLKTRLRGLLINRLHGGSWNADIDSADRSLRSPASTGGRSWLELKMNLPQYDSDFVTQPFAMKDDKSILSRKDKKGMIKSSLLYIDNKELRENLGNQLKDAWRKDDLTLVSSILDKISSLHAQIREEMNIFNSTSHATVDILSKLKNPRSIKISNNGLKYL